MNKNLYPSGLHSLAFAPIIMIITMIPLGNLASIGAILNWLMAIAILAVTVIVYSSQFKFLQPTYRQRIKNQHNFIAGAFLLVLAGGTIGNIHGMIAFDDWEDYSSILGFAMAAGFIGWVATYLCVLGNVVFIATNGTSEFVKVFGTIIRSICWLGIAGISFGAYSLSYSLHDPSTE